MSVEPITATAIIVGGSAWLLGKVLGPTAEYLGNEMRDHIAERRRNNVDKIVLRAAAKLGAKIDEPAGVPPRILKYIIDEGSFCDDSITTEYFAGVLAASRTGTADDDRGLPFLSLLSRLSTFDIRTHYVMYHLLRAVFQGVRISVSSLMMDRFRMWVPYSTLHCMVPGDWQDSHMRSSVSRLQREGLLGEGEWELYAGSPNIETFIPSLHGLEVFRWAYGYADHENGAVFSPSTDFSLLPEIELSFKGVGIRDGEQMFCRIQAGPSS